MILKYLDASQRLSVRSIDRGDDAGDIAVLVGLVRDLKINLAGFLALLDRLQIGAFFTAQGVQKYLMTVLTDQLGLRIPGDCRSRFIGHHDLAIRRQNHDTDRKAVKNIAELIVFQKNIVHGN